MSTGKRLAKRSIIGTRVCAPGVDGIWYSGVIHAVKTPANPRDNNNCINLTPNTKYSVRFDSKQDAIKRGPAREFRESELIGPGFRNILDVKLRPGQKVFLTYNGRESSGEVLDHDDKKDEVTVRLVFLGQEAPLELKKRLEEVRLLESRRSARLADQDRDTDFARLADMAGDRRKHSHSIDVPFALTQNGSRKRRPSFSQDEREYIFSSINDDDQMDECNAALVLMSLSCSPNSPHNGWETILGSSSGSSSASWSSGSGSSSPPLSDDGAPTTTSTIIRRNHRTTSLSTSDEGIVMDYNDDMPRKRRANETIFQCTWKGCGISYTTCSQITQHVRNAHLGPKKPEEHSDEEEFYYTEKESEIEESPSPTSPPTLSHRDMARPPHEDPEYQRKIVGSFRQDLLSLSKTSVKPPLPNIQAIVNMSTNQTFAPHNYTWSQQSPTSPQKHVRLSPRPSTSYAPYPSPTYSNVLAQQNHHHHHHQQQQQQQQQQMQQQKHLSQSYSITLPPQLSNNTKVSSMTQDNLSQNVGGCAGTSLAPTAGTAVSQATTPANHRSPLSPNRRTRGENKKCRKVYGMEHKDMWCTQCKWKKACSRFGD